MEHLVNENIHFIRQGRSLIVDMEPEYFSSLKDAGGRGTISAHIRHCIDMYTCFFMGLPEILIDYDHRERDHEVERNKFKAEQKLTEHVYRLLELRENPPENLEVHIRRVINNGDGVSTEHRIPSSILRELHILSSHTVHHYALIANILALHDLEYPEHFGVAPSTIAHWKKENKW